jgi:hypothetical protein
MIRVRVYDYDERDNEIFRCECELRECIDPRDPEYLDANLYLGQCGRFWVGGGASPLVLLTLSNASGQLTPG